MRHLGVVIESHHFKEKYVNNFVVNLNNQLQRLSKIAETEPQTAYAAFFGGFTNKLAHFICTIANVNDLLLPLEHKNRQNFIPVCLAIKEDLSTLATTM